MKKNILLLTVSLLLFGCFSTNDNNKQISTTSTFADEDQQSIVNTSLSQTTEIEIETQTNTYDYFYSYDTEIDSEINNAILVASSIQDEMNKIKKISDNYAKASAMANTQNELNFSSIWNYNIWDKELNNLWSRISKEADKDKVMNLLDTQRNWISMKEELVLINIDSEEDSGSIYPLLKNNILAEFTCNRCYILANELAKIKHENFVMPERSIYGTYVDNQGTNKIYSSIVTHKNIENDNEAIISIYRLGQTEGTFSDNGNGNFSYVSYDENVKGTIIFDNWEEATFEVTESIDSPFTIGEKFTFNFVI